MTRKASIKETGEEISQADWDRFDAAVARERAEREQRKPYERSETPRELIPARDDRADDLER